MIYAVGIRPSMTVIRDSSTIAVSDGTATVYGWVQDVRNLGGISFLTLRDRYGTLQVTMPKKKIDPELFEKLTKLPRESVVSITGDVKESNQTALGLELIPTSADVIGEAAVPLPMGVIDKVNVEMDTRLNHRFMDLRKPEIKAIFELKSMMVDLIEEAVRENGFTRVYTPKIGAAGAEGGAELFRVQYFDRPAYLSQSPQLYKQILMSTGLDRVYEIGRLFRNEGIDLTHNPEFTTCEFYMAYADVNDVMKMTEDMVSGIVKDITGGYKITYHPQGPGTEGVELDFTPPWKRYSMVEELEHQGGFKVPMPLESQETYDFLLAKCKELGVECTPPLTTPRLLDKLVEHFVEPLCRNPTFICDHPAIVSPLAKYHRSKPGMCERFELFVNHTELANAYTELNNPIVQRERFMQQAKDKSKGDEEAQCLDEDFCVALEHGLPPTGGWGLGVDRLTMFLTDSNNIKEVLLFPAMKPIDENKPEESA